jgi:hypothetical protein
MLLQLQRAINVFFESDVSGISRSIDTLYRNAKDPLFQGESQVSRELIQEDYRSRWSNNSAGGERLHLDGE